MAPARKRKNQATDISNAIIGIDLGTTNSVVAVMKHDNVMVIPSSEGKYLIPSCVSFSENSSKVFVGTAAVAKKGSNYRNTVYDAKRLIGMSFDHENVRNFQANAPFSILNEDGKPVIKVIHNNEKLVQHPYEISARVLQEVRETAENALRTRSDIDVVSITRAVVTVPAYFSMAQKTETMEAARLAGFIDDIHLITEPAAAAYAYGFEERRFNGYRLLVYDFGGGTFDVSIIEVCDKRFEVRAIDGDIQLGGRDLDILLRDYCAAEIKKGWEFDCLGTQLNASKLLEKCEQVKILLSQNDETSIYLGNLSTIHGEFDITREQFEAIARPTLMRSIKIVNRALRQAKFTVAQIDEVLLVGGTSRIPLVSELLMSEVGFEKRKLNRSVNADEAVARGAAIFASQIAQNSKLRKKNRMALVEVIPLSLGTGSCDSDEVFMPMLERNKTIPAICEKFFHTTTNDQASMTFSVYEGERQIASKNNRLGTLHIDGLSRGKAGNVVVKLTFEIDKNGILKVSATHKGKTSTMDMDYGARNADERDVEVTIRDAEQNREHDMVERKRLEAKTDFLTLIERSRYSCSAKRLSLCEQYDDWMSSNDDASRASIVQKQKEFNAEMRKMRDTGDRIVDPTFGTRRRTIKANGATTGKKLSNKKCSME